MPKYGLIELGGNRFMPTTAELATEPKVRTLDTPHTSINMANRKALEQIEDTEGKEWEVVAKYDTKVDDTDSKTLAKVARDSQGKYVVITEQGVTELSGFGNEFQKFDLGEHALGVMRDDLRDSIAVTGEVGIPGKNGYDLVESFAMFEEKATQQV